MNGYRSVRIRRGIVLGAVSALTVVTGSAFAAESQKSTQKGTVDGDSAASVRLAVISQGGELKSVKGLKFKDLLADCEGGPTAIQLNLFGAAKVDPSNRKFERSYGSKDEGIVKLEGKVSRSGDKVHGSISGSTVEIIGAGRCEVPDADFVTKA